MQYTLGMPDPTPQPALTNDDVLKVAALSKLAVADEDLDRERERLSAVLGYVDRLRTLDLEGVEPMTRASDEPARLRDDTPGESLPSETLANLAPDLFESCDREGNTERLIRVPKVLGEGKA